MEEQLAGGGHVGERRYLHAGNTVSTGVADPDQPSDLRRKWQRRIVSSWLRLGIFCCLDRGKSGWPGCGQDEERTGHGYRGVCQSPDIGARTVRGQKDLDVERWEHRLARLDHEFGALQGHDVVAVLEVKPELGKLELEDGNHIVGGGRRRGSAGTERCQRRDQQAERQASSASSESADPGRRAQRPAPSLPRGPYTKRPPTGPAPVAGLT